MQVGGKRSLKFDIVCFSVRLAEPIAGFDERTKRLLTGCPQSQESRAIGLDCKCKRRVAVDAIVSLTVRLNDRSIDY